MNTNTEVESLQDSIWKLCIGNNDIAYRHKQSKEEKIKIIRSWIKKKQLSVHPKFEQWISYETDPNIFTAIYVLVTLKIYHRGQAYARQQILMNKKYWNIWEKGNKYSFENL